MNKFDGIETLSKSVACAAKTCYVAMEVLNENEDGIPVKRILEILSQSIEFSDWENQIYQSTGQVRWKTIFYFYSTDFSKAGFITKQNGIWYITPEGKEAFKLGAKKLVEKAHAKYREWDKNRKSNKKDNVKEFTKIDSDNDEEEFFDPDILQKANLEQFETNAIEGIKDYISSKNPYQFQDMVATLLRAMKYYTPYTSPKGKDGGLDIVAYKDPLGADTPRVKVQVKHRPNSCISVPDIRSLVGLLNKDGDVGLFVTSGLFTNDSQRFARDSHIHVKLIDVDHFIQLWIEFYKYMTDEEKNQLPIKPIYYLGTNN